jgi:hypothetical protein
MSSGFKLSSLCLLALLFSWACAPDLDSLVAGNSGGSSSAGGDGAGAGPPAGPGSCENEVRNADETDVDCGGSSDCKRCAANLKCNTNNDCASEFCKAGKCAEPTCADGYKNQDETATDCGGSCAPGAACDDGVACEVAEDCKSEVCKEQICVGHCSSGKRESDETSVDCGGSECDACGEGERCEEASDCQSLVCNNNECQAASCTDRIQNQDESDKDCGGACSDEDKACPNAAKCNHGADCDSYVCTKGKCAEDLTIPAADMIDDFEDGDLLLRPLGGRVGNWYAYGDGSGIATEEIASIKRAASLSALHATGMDFTSWGSGVGVDLNNMGSGQVDKETYDASEYSGVTFWARAQDPVMVTLVLPDGDTDAAGKICTTCDHHYFKSFQFTTEWQRYTVSFADDFPEPEPGGVPKPGPLDPSRLVSVQFRVGAGATYQFYIDDLAFVRE